MTTTKTLNQIVSNNFSDAITKGIMFQFKGENFAYEYPYKQDNGLISAVFNHTGGRVEIDPREYGDKQVLVRQIVGREYVFV